MVSLKEIEVFLRYMRDLARESQNDPECKYLMKHFYEGELSIIDQTLMFMKEGKY